MINNQIKKIALVLASVPLILLILEIGVRITVPQPIAEIGFNDIYTISHSKSLKGNTKSLAPGMIRIKNGKAVHINSDGNRDYEYHLEKKEKVKRVAIVGSSVSFGYNLSVDETFGKQMETMLKKDSTGNKYEVLLFGRPGFKAKETYARIMDRIFDYDPDLIIYSFVQNNYEDQSAADYYSTQHEVISKHKQSNPDQSVSLLKNLRDQWNEYRNYRAIHFVRSNLHLYLFTANSLARVLRELSPAEKEKAQNIAVFNPDTPVFRRKIANTESWLSLMNNECAQRGVEFSILMHPYEMQLNRTGLEKWQAKGMTLKDDVLGFRTHQIMQVYADSVGINFIDLMPAFQQKIKSGNEYYLEGDYGHYSTLAHTLIATHLSGTVTEMLNH